MLVEHRNQSSCYCSANTPAGSLFHPPLGKAKHLTEIETSRDSFHLYFQHRALIPAFFPSALQPNCLENTITTSVFNQVIKTAITTVILPFLQSLYLVALLLQLRKSYSVLCLHFVFSPSHCSKHKTPWKESEKSGLKYKGDNYAAVSIRGLSPGRIYSLSTHAGSHRWLPAGLGRLPWCPGSTSALWWGRGDQRCSCKWTPSSLHPNQQAAPVRSHIQKKAFLTKESFIISALGQRISEGYFLEPQGQLQRTINHGNGMRNLQSCAYVPSWEAKWSTHPHHSAVLGRRDLKWSKIPAPRTEAHPSLPHTAPDPTS